MSQTPLSEKQHKELYDEIEAMSEKELDSYLGEMQSKFNCERFKAILNESLKDIQQKD